MDPLTQRSNLSINEIDIYPSNEYLLNEKNIENFRSKFRFIFGSQSINSATYEKISSILLTRLTFEIVCRTKFLTTSSFVDAYCI